jgi:hypothetical protein
MMTPHLRVETRSLDANNELYIKNGCVDGDI